MDGTTVRHVNERLLGVLEFIDDFNHACGRVINWFKRGAKGPILPQDYTPPSRRNPKIAAHKLLHKLRKKTVDQIVQPFPGVIEVLELLKAHGIPMAIVSNGLGKGYGHEILETFHLEQYFSAQVFREDINKSKPNPEPILLSLKRLGIDITNRDTIWYIGDRHKDVVAALAAHKASDARIVPIACAFNAAVAILDQGQNPEQIIMSYFDMAERLRDLLG